MIVSYSINATAKELDISVEEVNELIRTKKLDCFEWRNNKQIPSHQVQQLKKQRLKDLGKRIINNQLGQEDGNKETKRTF